MTMKCDYSEAKKAHWYFHFGGSAFFEEAMKNISLLLASYLCKILELLHRGTVDALFI